MKCERIGGATLYCGDVREILSGLSYEVVVTDPPWDQARGIPGAENPRGLFAAVAPGIARARCATVQLGAYTDPAFLAPLSALMPFLHLCWLRYIPAHYRGRLLIEGEPAYVFGTPPKSRPGRRVLPASCTTTGREASESEFIRGTGRNGTSAAKRARALELRHPMPRCLKHVRWLIEWHSDPQEVVCDPFMGSGTAGVAAASLGRPFVGIEVEPRFFDLACERISTANDQRRLFA